MPEPARGRFDPLPAAAAEPAHSFGQAIRAFFGNRILTLAALASGAANFITYGLSNFATLFLMREKGMTLEEVAIWYALAVGLGMGAGIFVSGRLIDRFGVTNKAAYASIPAWSLVLALPFFLGFAAADSWQVALPLLFVPLFLNSFFLPATVTFVQSEVDPGARVISGALLLLVMNLIGLGLGPTFVGMASDFFRPQYGEHALRMAFYALAPMYLVAALLFAWLARMIKRSSPASGELRQASD